MAAASIMNHRISRSGTMTKSRSCMRGCGRVSSGVSMVMLSYVSRSMSMGRSLYCRCPLAMTVLCVRPSSSSIFFVSRRHAVGDIIVWTQQAMLRNLLSLANPIGSVSMKDETLYTEPTRSLMSARAVCMFSSLLPRLEPRLRYRLCIVCS